MTDTLILLTIGGFIGYWIGSLRTERSHQRAINLAIIAEYGKERQHWDELRSRLEAEKRELEWVPKGLEEKP
jgi:hypothetical protein